MPKTVRCCEVQSHTVDADGCVKFDAEILNQIIEKKKHCIKDYAYIFHDLDRYTAVDQEDPKCIEGELKPEHFHLFLRFEREQPQQFADIAKWFDLKPEFVRKIKTTWEDCIAYLVHQNHPDKHQYSPDDIVANFDVGKILKNAAEKSTLNKILKRILDGDIREYNKTTAINNMLLVNHAKKINEAFKVRAEYLQATQQERNTEVIFITGGSGSGKTTLAKKIATERSMAYFVSSSSNDPLDGYAQQPCVILDDIRPDSLRLPDLLKLLDNHTASTIKSRYRNKYLDAELIILTSVLSIELFYSNVYGHENEPITQLKRRCGTYIQIFPQSIVISRWDNAAMEYSVPEVFKNDIVQQYIPPAPKDAETVQAEIKQLLPFLMPDPLPDDVVQKMSNPGEASDEKFYELMPLDKGG